MHSGRQIEWIDILVEEEDGQENDGGMDENVGDGQMDGKILKQMNAGMRKDGQTERGIGR